MKIMKLQKYFKDFTKGKLKRSSSRKSVEYVEKRNGSSQVKKYNVNTYDSVGNL
jgi:hypothetical protein